MTSSLAGMIGPISMVMIGMLFSGCGLETGLWKNGESMGLYFLKNDRGAGDHYPVPETGGTADPDGEAKTILLISLLAVIAPTAVTITQMAQLYKRMRHMQVRSMYLPRWCAS